MGIYSDYLNQKLSFDDLTQLRKEQLARISRLREDRDMLVMAADVDQQGAPISIAFADLLPVNDQLSNLSGTKVDLILETPGGSGEVAEDIVRLLRGKYEEVGVIVPGCAKSAGTIMAMAADEILMEPASALGPIDAQILRNGKVFSAEALLEGMEKIKTEVANAGRLNQAYIPILQGISPGELQAAQNSLDFAKRLVRDWLATYKFKNWNTHSGDGRPVTEEERTERAEEIATKLCNHSHWLTHGRSIKIADLEDMKLRITDYSENADLADAIRRYYTLLQMTFATNIYKVFETPESQIYRFTAQQVPPPPPPGQTADVAVIGVQCKNCSRKSQVQANLGQSAPLEPGHEPFPADNRFKCPGCGTEIDLTATRQQVEAQSGKPVVA
ncbi:MAG: Clp protease ClpP [Planctomycetota bacterium]